MPAIAKFFLLSIAIHSFAHEPFTIASGAEKIATIQRSPATMRVSGIFRDQAMPWSESGHISKISHKPALAYRSGIGSKQFGISSFRLATDASDFSKGFDVRAVDPIESKGFDYSKILPSSLSPISTSGEVAAQIFDYSVANFFNQDHIRNTSLGRAAKSVEKTMKAEVALGRETPDSTQHNLRFQMKATQSKASMEYRGFTHADLSYSVATRSTDLEIYENFGKNSQLIFHHSARPDEKRDILSIRLLY
jgi:hypothetical protein